MEDLQYTYPNYYLIIPAEVGFDKRLSYGEKLLYGMITSLYNMNQKCYATNKYFAPLLCVNEFTISRWINNLCDYGYIELNYAFNKKTNKKYRYITLVSGSAIKEQAKNMITVDPQSVEDDDVDPKPSNLFPEQIKEETKTQSKAKTNLNRYGELYNVCLYQEDYEKLKQLHPNIDEAIEVLDTYLGMHGDKKTLNKNHYAYFKSNSWVWAKVAQDNKPKPTSTTNKEEPTYKKPEDTLPIVPEDKKEMLEEVKRKVLKFNESYLEYEFDYSRLDDDKYTRGLYELYLDWDTANVIARKEHGEDFKYSSGQYEYFVQYIKFYFEALMKNCRKYNDNVLKNGYFRSDCKLFHKYIADCKAGKTEMQTAKLFMFRKDYEAKLRLGLTSDEELISEQKQHTAPKITDDDDDDLYD